MASQSITEGTGQTQGIPVAWAQWSKESSLIPGSLGAERGGVPEPQSSGEGDILRGEERISTQGKSVYVSHM